jgi:hypothetical protein
MSLESQVFLPSLNEKVTPSFGIDLDFVCKIAMSLPW